MRSKTYASSQKLWRVVREPDGYYYEIRLKGMVIDRLPVKGASETYLKCEGVIE